MMTTSRCPNSIMVVIIVIILVTTTTTFPAAAAERRRLQEDQEPFLSYVPITAVTDQAVIDLDLKAMEAQLGIGTVEGTASALRIYTGGAFSGSYAELTLKDGIPYDIGAGTTVVGTSKDGAVTQGITMLPLSRGEDTIFVFYQPLPSQASWDYCKVARLCFASSGYVEIDGYIEYEYSYDPSTSNKNARTLQKFSSLAQTKMYQCESPSCPYPTFVKFYKYYGVFDYANQWTLSAFGGTSTSFFKGNAPFEVYGGTGTAAAITMGTVLMSTWMQVIAKMEQAVDLCVEGGCSSFAECLDGVSGANPWDEAVAFYVGSGSQSSWEDGNLLFTYAQKQCQLFGTCQNDRLPQGIATVNQAILDEFNMGQQYLDMGNCTSASESVAEITRLMTIPLVQGTIASAYNIEKNRNEQIEAEGATAAASVLPLVHACSPDDASIIYDNMQVGNRRGGTDFETVKTALERNYNCLGISCEDIGGLVDPASGGGYIQAAEPCAVVDIDVDAEAIVDGPTSSPTIAATKVSRDMVCDINSTAFDGILCLGDCLPGACCFHNSTTECPVDCSTYDICSVVESDILDSETHVDLDCESQQNIFSHCPDDDTVEEVGGSNTTEDTEDIAVDDGDTEDIAVDDQGNTGGGGTNPPATTPPSSAASVPWGMPTGFTLLFSIFTGVLL